MLHENVLMSSRITELEEQLEIMTRRKARKRKRIQHGGTMEYGAASAQVTAESSPAAQRSKNSRGSGDQESAHLALRRCGLCGNTGHNARTYKKDAK